MKLHHHDGAPLPTQGLNWRNSHRPVRPRASTSGAARLGRAALQEHLLELQGFLVDVRASVMTMACEMQCNGVAARIVGAPSWPRVWRG